MASKRLEIFSHLVELLVVSSAQLLRALLLGAQFTLIKFWKVFSGSAPRALGDELGGLLLHRLDAGLTAAVLISGPVLVAAPVTFVLSYFEDVADPVEL